MLNERSRWETNESETAPARNWKKNKFIFAHKRLEKSFPPYFFCVPAKTFLCSRQFIFLSRRILSSRQKNSTWSHVGSGTENPQLDPLTLRPHINYFAGATPLMNSSRQDKFSHTLYNFKLLWGMEMGFAGEANPTGSKYLLPTRDVPGCTY